MKTRVEVRPIVREVLPWLPGNWEIEKGDWEYSDNCVALSDEGHKLYFRIEHGRLRVSGSYPAYQDHVCVITGRDRPKITCAITRPPEDIGKDIMRRFWSDYTALWDDAVRLVEMHSVRNTSAREEMTDLAKRMPLGGYYYGGRDADLYVSPTATGDFLLGGAYKTTMKCKYRSAGDVDVSLDHVPIRVARKIVELLKEEQITPIAGVKEE